MGGHWRGRVIARQGDRLQLRVDGGTRFRLSYDAPTAGANANGRAAP